MENQDTTIRTEKLNYEDRCQLRIASNSSIMKLKDKSIEAKRKMDSLPKWQYVLLIVCLIFVICYVLLYVFLFTRSERKSLVLYAIVSIFILMLILYFII